MIRKILIALLVALVVIQFFRPEKNISNAAQPNSIAKVYPMPPHVDTIMQHACYDCHSNNTIYPWYFHFQPSAWFVANHVKHGKHHLNFDEFMNYSKEKQDDKLKDLIDMVNEGDMPLSSYTLMHSDARLSREDKDAIMAWAKDVREKIGVNKK